jgi:dipeptidyl aminopeptidase/acylaminoacyl peptidase
MTALGSGACETDGLDIAPDGRIAVSDNCHARTGREVGLIGKDGFEGLSEANQTAMDPVFFNKGSALAYLAGSGDGMDVEVRSGAVAQRLFGLASPNAKSEVAFKAADGLLLHSILMRPPGKGPFPSVIFLHGGPQRQMLSGAEPGGFYARWSAILSDLNARGVAVLILDYRGGPGEGRDFRRIAEVGRAGGAEDRDVLAARRYLIDQGLADPARIALVGDSWGGWLCAYSLSLHSDLFAAGVDVSGVFDLSETGYGPTMAEDLRRKAREASAAGHIETLNAPLLVIHGDLDRTVPYAQAVELTAALKARGAPVEGLTLTGSAHAPRTGADWDLMADRISEFLKRTLINRR